MGSQHGMAMRAERGHGGGRGRASDAGTEKKKTTRVMDQLPEIWALMRPRRGLLAIGMVLMAINRVSGLALPFTTKYLVDNVMIHHQTRLLMPLVGGVLLATILQGVTSYTLTQTLSKAAQRMITELRRKVQEHVGRLPVAYYDANKTGALVSRIMSDVEGVRNLIGTGLVEFLGGLLTAVIALVMLLRISPVMTGLAFALLLVSMVGLRKAFSVLRPIFRERSKINAEVSGRLTESLSGVRVVKGYHAEDREARRIHQGRAAPARQRDQIADHHVHDEFFDDGAGRRGWRAGDAGGCAPGAGRKNHGWPIHELHGVSGVHDRAGVSGRGHRHAIDRSGRGTGAHARSARRAARG